MRNQITGAVHLGSGSINAYGTHYRPTFAASKARAAVPEDTRPLHVKMRELYHETGTWEAVAIAHGYDKGQNAKRYALMQERSAARSVRQPGLRKDAMTPRQRVSKLGLES